MPAISLSSVLLPEPLRPTMPKNSPCSTANETSRTRVEAVERAAAERVQRTLLERVHLLVRAEEASSRRPPRRWPGHPRPWLYDRRRLSGGLAGIRAHVRQRRHPHVQPASRASRTCSTRCAARRSAISRWSSSTARRPTARRRCSRRSATRCACVDEPGAQPVALAQPRHRRGRRRDRRVPPLGHEHRVESDLG